MREACRVGREVLDIAGSKVRPGITTEEIDKVVFEECIKRDAYPSPLNYYFFPKSVCTYYQVRAVILDLSMRWSVTESPILVYYRAGTSSTSTSLCTTRAIMAISTRLSLLEECLTKMSVSSSVPTRVFVMRSPTVAFLLSSDRSEAQYAHKGRWKSR